MSACTVTCRSPHVAIESSHIAFVWRPAELTAALMRWPVKSVCTGNPAQQLVQRRPV